MRVKMGAQELVEMGRSRKCPPGEILREGYRRKGYTREDGARVEATRVPPTCVPDKGAPGKTPPRKQWAPQFEKGELGGWHKNQAADKRRRILKGLLKDEPCVTVLRKVNAIANVTTDRPTERKLRADYDWLYDQSACKLKTKKDKK